jgi:hypothetical protein
MDDAENGTTTMLWKSKKDGKNQTTSNTAYVTHCSSTAVTVRSSEHDQRKGIFSLSKQKIFIVIKTRESFDKIMKRFHSE